MDIISFTETKNAGVQITINRRDLRDIVREVELPFATREGQPDIIGSYSGSPVEIVLLPFRHRLGQPDPLYSEDDGNVHVLCCQCGEPGCWPWAVRIEIRPQEIIWRDFHQPHRRPNSRAGEWK